MRQWLAENNGSASGAWIITFKKPDPRHLSYDTLVDEALCFGWIDSLPRALDAQRSMRLLTPRKPKSAWSGVNKARIERLIADNKMAPPGLKAVAAAKASGQWNKLDAVEALVIPEDLASALAAVPVARQHFEAFPRSVKRAILEWISLAKKADTRAARIAETVDKARNNLRANQWRQVSQPQQD